VHASDLEVGGDDLHKHNSKDRLNEKLKRRPGSKNANMERKDVM
jgi:hypothetical protein